MNEIWFGTVNLLRVAHSFAAAPRIMATLGTLLRDPQVSLDEVAEQVRQDSTLAARLLRIANSAAFAPAEPVASIQDAASLIGLREVHRLVGAVTVDQFSLRNYPLYGFSGHQLRDNALLVALLMEQLAPSFQADASAAYSAGLFRSIGKLALAKLADEGAPTRPFQTDESSLPLMVWERNSFGRTSNDATAAILHEWHFPPELAQAVAEHYEPGPDHRSLARLLNLAARVADDLGHGLPGEARYWLDPAEAASAAGINPRRLERAIPDAVSAFDRITGSIG